MVDTRVTLSGITLDNPVIPASGTFGFGQEFREFYDINLLGTFSFKGTTREPRFEETPPRASRSAPRACSTPWGCKTRAWSNDRPKNWLQACHLFHKPVMANVNGFSVEEYADVAQRLDAQPQVGWLEVNSSAAPMCMAAAWPLAPTRRTPPP